MSNASVIIENIVDVIFLGHCLDGYLELYLRVSHPHIISFVESRDNTKALHNGGHSDDFHRLHMF